MIMWSLCGAMALGNREKIVPLFTHACHWHPDRDPHIPLVSSHALIIIDSHKARHLVTLALYFFHTSPAPFTLWLWKQMRPQTRY